MSDGEGRQSRPTIGLMMIVRNEALTLPRLASSVIGQINHWTIVDTGSTDDTVEVARLIFDGVPGELIEDEWRGYGPSRNVALEAAAPHSDWLLTMDADETLHGSLGDVSFDADTDGVTAEERMASLHWWKPRLVRSDAGWRWYGRAHECLQVEDREPVLAPTEAIWVEHHADGGSRHGKYQRELALLIEDWKEQPGDPRTAFYLARTYEGLDHLDYAIRWFRTRLDLGGWDEESFYARLTLGGCLLRSGATEEGCGTLWRAWGERPWRAEPLVVLAGQYRAMQAWPLAWEAISLAFEHCGVRPDGELSRDEPDSLFVDQAVIEWQAAYEASISAWYVGEVERGRELNDYLLSLSGLPADIQTAVAANVAFYEGEVSSSDPSA